MNHQSRKPTTSILAAAALALVGFISTQPAHAQGALTPPGAPAPTMKSLDQIEARTPISSAPFIITQPGSYYLTTNLTISGSGSGGPQSLIYVISVSANNVTLDLNGFTLTSTEITSAHSVGIKLNSVTNIKILNGFISGAVTNNAGTYDGRGFAYGIYYTGNPPVNARVTGVTVSGCRFHGIYLSDNCMVEACTVNTVGNFGIVAGSVSDSTAQNCGDTAIYAYGTANNCSGSSYSGWGVKASTANNCSGVTMGDSFGVYASIATGCYGSSSTGTGLVAFIATSCSGSSLIVSHSLNTF